MAATFALSPATTADLNSFQNVEKSDSAKAFGNDKRIKIPANQACALITGIETNDFSSDAFIVCLIMMFLSLGFSAVLKITANCAAASGLLIFLVAHRRAGLTVESVIGLFAGDFQLPMYKSFGDVAAIFPGLKHQN